MDTLRSTVGFGLVSLSINMGHIWSQLAYSYKKAYAGAALLFCRSLGPHIEALTEHAVWNCKRQMYPVTYLGAWIVPILCGFPQYIGWGLTGQPTVARGAVAHGRLAYWASIPCIHVMSISYASLSFSVTVLVVFC